MPEKRFILLGALFAGLAVSIGAWGAHGGATLLNEITTVTFHKAVRYQMHHALALLAIGMIINLWPEQRKILIISGWLFTAGIVLFSGSLYLRAFLAVDSGYITPLGGISFISGWILLAWAAYQEVPSAE
jgi:uncharacterized membrane protein YgdD (TMEM256/DUF423 family)